jgi:GAF domain-containing protein
VRPDRPVAGVAGDWSRAGKFAQFALELHDVDGVEETVEAVAQFALQAVGCTAASVVLIVKSCRPVLMSLTDPVLGEVYREQLAAGTGPLLDTISSEQVVLIDDVATESRWSAQWVRQMTDAGIRSAVHMPLSVTRKAEAVLSLYSDQLYAFTDDDLAIAGILARHASVAIASARNEVSMYAAVDARKLVGQAMGILMERFDLTGEMAFEVLKRYSQDYNRKLRDVAQELVDTRTLPYMQKRAS